MKLQNSEVKHLKSYIEKYQEIHEKIRDLEVKLNQISDERDLIYSSMKDLQNSAIKIREEEKKFVDLLIKKYGNFDLDMKTFEIKKA